jgi:hypothetical protein
VEIDRRVESFPSSSEALSEPARKIIVTDLTAVSASWLGALATLIVALAVVLWMVWRLGSRGPGPIDPAEAITARRSTQCLRSAPPPPVLRFSRSSDKITLVIIFGPPLWER